MPAVRVDGVCKSFARRGHATLKDVAVRGRGRTRPPRFVALRDVTFDVAAGRTVGLVGHNGAGQSTLLRLVGGVGRPDRGRISVTGSVAALFELGTGLHPELTGRESVLVAGVLAGLTRAQVRARLDDIVEFAGLADVLDEPTRTYSTGMQSRLAFATAVHVDPDVLLVDEILAVGDLAFQTRCLDRLRAMQRGGVTVLLVSHDPALVEDLCDEVVWLQGGRVIGQGRPREVLRRYRAAMEDETRRVTPCDVPVAVTADGRELRVHDNRFGSLEAQVAAVRVTDAWGLAARRLAPGDGMRLAIDLHLGTAERPVQLTATLVRDDGVVCLEAATTVATTDETAHRTVSVDRLDLAPGRYGWSVGLYRADWSGTLDLHWNAYPLEVAGVPVPSAPVIAPPLQWSITTDLPPLAGAPHSTSRGLTA